MHDMISAVKDAARDYFPQIVEIRHNLHAYPELSFQEVETSHRIRTYLSEHGIAYTEGWAGHGVVASIKGSHPGRVVMLRADMDALPIQEETNISFRSRNEGVMHACGHDIHTSSLLGVAGILQKLKNEIHGEVKLIFQPGEEKLPGGASLMIKEGLFEKTKPDWILGQHVYPALPAGHVGFREGLYMASSDEIYITITGRGGHGATPHACIDPISTASRVVIGLQEIISRFTNPLSPSVLSIGRIYSDGGATNVIPDVVHLEGTFRTMDESWRKKAHALIRNLVIHTCEASGAQAQINIITGYPSLKNDERLTKMCRNAAIAFLGDDKVHELPQRMSSEDFAYYTYEVPGSFYRLGTGWDEPEKNHPVHSNKFEVNEAALETGMGLMAYIVMSGYPHP